jgi:hypothetical protein
LPGIVTLLAVGIYPVIYALWASLHKVDLAMLAAGTPFNGGQNYISAFFNSLFTGVVARSLVFLAWISTRPNSPNTARFCRAYALMRRVRLFHQGTFTGESMIPEALMIGR